MAEPLPTESDDGPDDRAAVAPSASAEPAAPLADADLVALVERAAAGEATAAELALLERDRRRWITTLDDLLEQTEDDLESVRRLRGPEREQVVADFEAERNRLQAALDVLESAADGSAGVIESPGETRLQMSWHDGRLVVWAAGPGAPPADAEQLVELLRGAGAPGGGWEEHAPVDLPVSAPAAALGTTVGGILGWLAAVGSGQVGAGTGASVRWLGHIAAWGVQLVARGSIVPTLKLETTGGKGQSHSAPIEQAVRWRPALVDAARLDSLAASMPGPVTLLHRSGGKEVVHAVLDAVVHAIVSDAASRLELPAPPPNPRSTTEVAEALLTRLDGSTFTAPMRAGAELSSRLERWAKAITDTVSTRLVVALDPPDSGGAWFLSVLGPNPEGELVPVEVALVDSRSKRQMSQQLSRLERLLPALQRPGGLRRGQVYLSQDEAWELMATTGAVLEAAGFEVRVPALSRRRPTPTLRLTTEADETVVGANQLTAVRWSAVFDDVELTASEIAALAAEARPLVRSRGRWVELDKADLAEAAAALAEHGNRTEMTGAEVLRFGVGLDGSPLAGGISVTGSSWAADLLTRAAEASTEPVASPPGFEGELRSYQAEALGWLGFLDAVQLGGCLALDMGLGKTPTVLAHIARTAADGGTALVIAPPAVVGNWASEAAKFTPGLRVVVHHGASRASADELAAEVEGADVVITTYGTAVRDVEALSSLHWRRVVLDEAQAIKNPANETSQQLRRIPSDMRLALTGTPVENGLGDLWAILDYTNPGLVGSRPTFIAQLSAKSEGKGRQAAESGLRALNGILVFRRTKSEPAVAAELPDRIDELDHCTMTPEQIGLYQAVLDKLVVPTPGDGDEEEGPAQGQILAAITALKQICNHPVAYEDDGGPLAGRSGKLARLEEIVDQVYAADERVLVFTHFARWGERLADHLTERFGIPVACYHGGLSRTERDRIIHEFQNGEGPGALVLSLKAGGTGLNLTAASHVVLYDRWWNPAVEDQARDRAWRIGQTRTVVSHRLVCPGTVDERVEEVVAGKRHIADLVLPRSSSLADLDATQLRSALGLRPESLLTDDDPTPSDREPDGPDPDGSDPDEEAAA
ncbi:DEAD/DEAH box helicase [Actinomarinicola tropica]|uniref:ATP-dependent helicase n=1 Tax=Actinomarinicola tropica TaxID=2789776 RepID=A0A5Q2RKT3_9ACTN|nr:DEAD/DEAH box helicase [Actinomarinicola tropica]QGG95036.1 ATP-dependent helicase [Actinomarinicola tropica]